MLRSWKLSGLALGSLALGMWLYLQQDSSDEVATERIQICLPDLDPAFDGFRLVQISDIHIGGWMTSARLVSIADRINALAPDAVVITGDFVSYKVREHVQELVDGLGCLSAPEGVFAVLGNHDHHAGTGGVRAVFEQTGVRELCNRVHTVNRRGSLLHLVGVDDPFRGQPDLVSPLALIENRPGPAILLAHSPDYADVAAAAGRFALQLSGHSHGGQIVLPVFGAPFLPAYARKYPRGLYQVGDMLLYTNRGLGRVHLNYRLNSQPEITLFTLRAHCGRCPDGGTGGE